MTVILNQEGKRRIAVVGSKSGRGLPLCYTTFKDQLPSGSHKTCARVLSSVLSFPKYLLFRAPQSGSAKLTNLDIFGQVELYHNHNQP